MNSDALQIEAEMKLPWNHRDRKSVPDTLFALRNLPGAHWSRNSVQSLISDGYRGNAIVYRCVRMIAEAAASIPFESKPEGLSALLQRPSPEESGQAFFERLYTDLQISGAAFAEAISLQSGEVPKALYALRFDRLRPVYTQQGHLLHYSYKVGRRERRILPERDGWMPVLTLKLYDPGQSDQGLSPLVAARKALDLHNGSAAWAKALIDNAARPSGALVYDRQGGHLSHAQFDRLKQELNAQHSGAENAGRPLLLEGGLDWKPMSLTPAEMDFQDTRHAAAREIALTFGVPPMLLGIPGDNTYATYKEAHLAFWRLTVLPLVQKCASTVSIWLSERFEGAHIVPQIEGVPAFASERDALWARISAAAFLSDAEKRSMLGLM